MVSYDTFALWFLVLYIAAPVGLCVLAGSLHPGAKLKGLVVGASVGIGTMILGFFAGAYLANLEVGGTRPHIILPVLLTLAAVTATWWLCALGFELEDGDGGIPTKGR